MRKIGLATFLSGVLLAALFYLLRQTDWFAAETARGMSDFAELVESAFWAALLVVFFGIFLLLLSLRPTQNPPENEAPAPLLRTWICPACGGENPESGLRCTVCGTPRDRGNVPSWHCPFCGTENPETASQCQICAAPRDRLLLTWVCEGCGHENPETETRCTACQRRRFAAETSWICPICGGANDAKTETCRYCGMKPREDGWICGYCGRKNRDSRTSCVGCGRPKGYRGRSWLCPVCGTQNRSDREICVGCGQPREK